MIEGKKIAIIGGNGLIGTSFVSACIENGAEVIVLDKLKSIKLNKNKKSLSFFKFDITKEESIIKFFNFLNNQKIKLDALVNVAYPKSKKFGTPFEEIKAPHLKDDLFNQLGSSILLSKYSIKYFENIGGGNLIFLSSIQGFMSPKFSHYEGTKMNSPIEYSAIKAGVIAITKYLAKLCKNKNIRVNCISPGGIKNSQPNSFLKKYRNDCVSKGMLDPFDLNGVLLMLLSDDTKYLTGQNIIIDDGWSL